MEDVETKLQSSQKRTESGKLNNPYAKDQPLTLSNLPPIKYDEAYKFSEPEWAYRIMEVKLRLQRKARPFIELEHAWGKYLKHSKNIRKGYDYHSRDEYLQEQRDALMTFALGVTPRVLFIYIRDLSNSETTVFLEAMGRKILGGRIFEVLDDLLPRKDN